MQNKKKRRRLKKIALVIFEISVIVIVLCYMYIWGKYEKIFCENTIINGEDCSSLTIDEAKKVIQDKQEQYILEITFKDNEIEVITGEQIGLTINNLDDELNNIKKRQRNNLLLSGGVYNLNKCSYDEEKLKTVLSNKKQLQEEYMKNKTAVEYVYNSDKKFFETKKEKNYYLNFEQVFDVVSVAIANGETNISLEEFYVLQESDKKTLNELNSLITSKIIYDLPGEEKIVLDSDKIYSWLVQEKEGIFIKDENVWNQGITEFVQNELKPVAETLNKDREFKPTGKQYTIFVNSGNYGYQLDEEAEIEKLKQELENHKIVHREPCYKKVEVESNENYGLGESYVEIDLTRQKVWVYVDGKLEVETDCVTGCVKKEYDTPTGIFTLTYKQKDAILRGRKLSKGKYEYESPVDYWMPFNGGIGLHDATWRSTFGSDIYINNGSHGCINLPLEATEKIYNIINKEMPIIVYKSE